jgi:hypothetical protein
MTRHTKTQKKSKKSGLKTVKNGLVQVTTVFIQREGECYNNKRRESLFVSNVFRRKPIFKAIKQMKIEQIYYFRHLSRLSIGLLNE